MTAQPSTRHPHPGLRYALRMMRRAPGFTAISLLSLGLGIGANTAILSLVHTLMLRLLPVRDPQQLVELLNQAPGRAPRQRFLLAELPALPRPQPRPDRPHRLFSRPPHRARRGPRSGNRGWRIRGE